MLVVAAQLVRAVMSYPAHVHRCVCIPQEIASYLKRQFEEEYQHTWHAFVGYNFSSFVTHEAGKYIYFYIGQKGFVIFSTS